MPTFSKLLLGSMTSGYVPSIAKTGVHPLDGARYMRDVHHARLLLRALVGQHSCAIIEAEERGLRDPSRRSRVLRHDHDADR